MLRIHVASAQHHLTLEGKPAMMRDLANAILRELGRSTVALPGGEQVAIVRRRSHFGRRRVSPETLALYQRIRARAMQGQTWKAAALAEGERNWERAYKFFLKRADRGPKVLGGGA